MSEFLALLKRMPSVAVDCPLITGKPPLRRRVVFDPCTGMVFHPDSSGAFDLSAATEKLLERLERSGWEVVVRLPGE